jgi:hypothetical protein
MAKMTRERTLQERRVLKQEKKDERKRAAAEARGESAESTLPAETPDDD